MPKYHTTFKPASVQYNSVPLFDIRTSATDYAILKMLELEIDAASGTAAISFGLATPSALGAALPSGIPMIGEDAATAPNISIATNWSVVPTMPAAFFRRFTIGSNLENASARLLFPEGIKIAKNSALSLWVIAGGVTTAPQQFTVSMEIDG
ncbi:hypothetical protein QM467_04820 [Rhodoblastus sp. 17X3]|uniref:hypothetical protein n=1 Tax=Rhodoblastus sp. 17X3 TaxID=3047026 RepID=UPI0024B8105D|nr:hypothetical protein [Rhodoblastus sp. 17X3]MDI9847383.1 hypothetical protein [Rhodoblastus sp. 17X3]